MLNAIQQGILTKSTKTRLEELEEAKADLEVRIDNEKLAKPKISEEQFLHFYISSRFWTPASLPTGNGSLTRSSTGFTSTMTSW